MYCVEEEIGCDGALALRGIEPARDRAEVEREGQRALGRGCRPADAEHEHGGAQDRRQLTDGSEWCHGWTSSVAGISVAGHLTRRQRFRPNPVLRASFS